MRTLNIGSAVVAVCSLIVAFGVAAPANAAPLDIRSSATPESIWSPPDDADKGGAPELKVPDEAWEPKEGDRLVASPKDAEKGIAPFGAPVGTVAGAPGVGELPWFSFQDFQLSPYSSAQVNIANGNLLVKENDFEIAAPGYALRHDRYYNGLSTARGSLGGGWHSNNGTYDVGVRDAGTYADYYAPNGAKFRFTRVGATNNYTAPAGSNLSMIRDMNSGDFRFVITNNRTGEKSKFAISGHLTATVDRNDVGEYYNISSGNIISVYNQNGRGLKLNWSMEGFLDRVEDTAGRAVEYTYDTAEPRLLSVRAVDGKVTSYTYDSSGRLATITLPSAAAATTVVTFTYDTSHRVTKVSQQPGIETTFAYTATQTTVTDSNGKTATYTKDNLGRITTTKDALNRTRSQTWTANSDIATATDGTGSNVTTYTYDGNANRTNAQLPTGAAASAAYTVGSGCSAPNTGTAFQPKCSTDDAGNKKSFQYDAVGNVLKQTDTTSSTATVEFERTYGSCPGFAGQVCTTKDGNGNVTTFLYDAEGDLTKITPPAPLGATTYTHDSLGRVTSVKDGNGNTTRYDYDVRDRIVLTTYQDGQTVTSTYLANGLEDTRVDSGGGAINFDYNHQGLILKQTGPRAGVTQTMTYDEVGNMLTYTDSGGTVTYSYDAANQLTRLQEPGGTCPASGVPAANSGCILFEYNNNALEVKRITPGGANTVTTRDATGRPTRITAKAASGVVAVDIGYTYTVPGTTNDRANVQTRVAHKEEGITAGAVTSYAYDSRNRITLAQEKVGATVTASWGYAYDGAGNRTSQVRSGATGAQAGTTTFGYNAANQIVSATGQTATWTYDGAGNQTRNGSTGVASTFGDRAETVSIGGTASGYFGQGNTDRLSSGAVAFNSSSLGLMQRTAGGATVNYSRTPAGDPLSSRGGAGGYYVQDHLGSVVGMFTSAGAYSGGYSYSPYGESRATSTNASVAANALRYIGGHHEGGGIYKLGARYYDTSLGRFTQSDPSGQEKYPYAYGSCNPVNSTDPTGLVTRACAIALLETTLGVAGAISAISALAASALGTGGLSLLAGGLYASTFVWNAFETFIAVGDAVREC